MKQISIYMLLTGTLLACGDKETDTAETDTNTDTAGDTEQDIDTDEDTNTDTDEDTDEDTDTNDNTDTDEDTDTNVEDPLADATCDMNFAGCTEQDFADNDFRDSTGPISINMVAMQPYSPKCLTVKVGQTVQIGASGGHPFKKECAEDSVMDAQDNSTSQVEFTFTTPGYYNYRCAVSAHAAMQGNIRVLPE